MVELMFNNHIYVCKEGTLSEKNYSEGFTEIPSENLPGISAGKFAIVGKELRDLLFEQIYAACDYSTNFYTVEQPLFNYIIYKLLGNEYYIDFDLLTEYTSFNGEEYNKSKTIFNDIGGDPGNGDSHIKRIMNTLSLYLIDIY